MGASVFARFKEWQKRPEHKNAVPTAPSYYNFDVLSRFPIADFLVRDTHPNNHPAENFQGKVFYPLDVNLDILMKKGQELYENARSRFFTECCPDDGDE
jgi:hypothetical protein